MFTLEIYNGGIRVCYENKKDEQKFTNEVRFYNTNNFQYRELNHKIIPYYDRILDELRKRIIFNVKMITDMNSETNNCGIFSNTTFYLHGAVYTEPVCERPYTTDAEKEDTIQYVLAKQAMVVSSILYNLIREEAIHAAISYERYVEKHQDQDDVKKLEMTIDTLFGMKLKFMPDDTNKNTDNMSMPENNVITALYNSRQLAEVPFPLKSMVNIKLSASDGDRVFNEINYTTSPERIVDSIINMYYSMLFKSWFCTASAEQPMSTAPVDGV